MLNSLELLGPTLSSPPVGSSPTFLESFACLKNDRTQQYRVLSGTALDPDTGMELGAGIVPDWSSLVKAEKQILKRESKSLQIAAWLAEDSLRLYGIHSAKDGIELIHKLQVDYWADVHPNPDEDGDLWERSGLLNGFGSGMAAALREASLVGQDGYTIADWEAASSGHHQGGSIDSIGQALTHQPETGRTALIEALESSQAALVALEAFLEEKYTEDDDISLFPFNQMINRCLELLRRFDGKKQVEDEAKTEGHQPQVLAPSPHQSDSTPSVDVAPTHAVPVTSTQLIQIPDLGPSNVAVQARKLKYKDGLRLFQQAYDGSRTGRQRFHLRLELAEFCLKDDYIDLARPLLAELWAIAEKKILREWEDPRIWARLVAAQHRVALNPPGRPSNAAAQALFDTLCKVDIERAYESFLENEKT